MLTLGTLIQNNLGSPMLGLIYCRPLLHIATVMLCVDRYRLMVNNCLPSISCKRFDSTFIWQHATTYRMLDGLPWTCLSRPHFRTRLTLCEDDVSRPGYRVPTCWCLRKTLEKSDCRGNTFRSYLAQAFKWLMLSSDVILLCVLFLSMIDRPRRQSFVGKQS